jgi:hypothetical protein
MPVDLSAYRVVGGERPMATFKENNTIDAIQAAMNSIPASQIHGYPNNAAVFLNGVGGWSVPGIIGGAVTVLLKTTTTDVVNTTVKGDLLAGEIVIPAGAMTATGSIKFWMAGSYLNNSAGANQTITLELKLGTSVLWDSLTSDLISSNAARHAWWFHGLLQAFSLTNIHGGGYFGMGDRSTAQGGTGRDADTTVGGGRALHGEFQAAPVTTNMAVAQNLTFSVTHSAVHASLSMRLDFARFEVS